MNKIFILRYIIYKERLIGKLIVNLLSFKANNYWKD